MREWGFWEWLTYSLIAIAALMPALGFAMNTETALAERTRRLRESGFWKFTPAVALSVSACLIIANQMGWTAQSKAPAAADNASTGFPYGIVTVVGAIVVFLLITGWAMMALRLRQAERHAPSISQILTLQHIRPSSSQGPNISFPHKIWVILQNKTDNEVIVREASWFAEAGGVETLFSRHPWSLKRGPNWDGPEVFDIPVPPLGLIRTWFAIAAPIEMEEVAQRIITKRLGTVVIPITINGRNTKETIRFAG